MATFRLVLVCVTAFKFAEGASSANILSALGRANGKRFVLGGGNLDPENAEIWGTIVEMAGGRGVARIGIVTSASADPNDSIWYNTGLLRDHYGAADVLHINVSIWDSSVAHDQNLVNQIQTVTGFYFSGGDQSRVIQSMFEPGHTDTPVLAAIRAQFESGAVITGSSAGAVCHSTAVMVTGGYSWEALKYGAMTDSNKAGDLTYNPDGGLGFLDGYVLDTHFADRGREGRMIRLISDTMHQPRGVSHGIGVGENTALVITHAGTNQAEGRVIGQNGVTFIDMTSSSVDNSGRYIAISDIYMTYLTHGDVYNLHTHDVTFASDKIPLAGNENYDHALSTDDIFYGKSSTPGRKPEFVRSATSIFDARLDTTTYGTTFERNPRFRVDMSRVGGRNAMGYVKRMGDFHSDLHSYKDMWVSVHEA